MVSLLVVLVAAALLGPLGVLPDRVAVLIIGLATVGVGVVVGVFGFTTPETVAVLGIRASIRVARLLGGIAVVLGLAMVVFATSFQA